MASPPFNIAETSPADDDFISPFPGIERTFRDVVESWLKVEHNVQGRHDKVSLDDQNADLTIATDVVGIWNKDGALRTRNGAGAVTNIPMDSSLLATLASPAFTGNPTAPTPDEGDNDTSIATSLFVTRAITTLTDLLVNRVPPPSSFKNLEIKVTGNTGLTASADYVTMFDGTNVVTRALSSTINLATTGANALDVGSLSPATWYAVFSIAKEDGTVAGLVSLSATSPSMPSGYTYKARIGWLRTASASAQLMGTWQFGRRVQYVVGLAQTSSAVQLISGTSGSTSVPSWTAVSISNYVPSTAGIIFVSPWNNGSGRVIVAPNTSYGPYTSTTNPPPIIGALQASAISPLLLESTNIYYASDAGVNSALFVTGWEDNI